MSQTIAIGGQDFEYLRTNQYFLLINPISSENGGKMEIRLR